MADRQCSLQQHTSNMIALEKHILEAVERQANDESVKAHAEAARLIEHIRGTLAGHVKSLEAYQDELGNEWAAAVKAAVTTVAGWLAGVYDKVREHEVSRMLRDDYTALSLAAISYTMLHTTALGNGDRTLAALAAQHLKHLTPLIVEISEVIPSVVAVEVKAHVATFDTSVVAESVSATQEAWKARISESYAG